MLVHITTSTKQCAHGKTDYCAHGGRWKIRCSKSKERCCGNDVETRNNE
jgi:hypothetical protein